jgi:hypothetical protein
MRWPVGGPVLILKGHPESLSTMSSRDFTERAHAERLARIRTELMRRMRPVCEDMPDELFLELVEGMAVTQLKYEMGEGPRPT